MRILTPAAAEASSLDSTPVDVTVHDVRFSQIWSGIDKLLLKSQPTHCYVQFNSGSNRLVNVIYNWG